MDAPWESIDCFLTLCYECKERIPETTWSSRYCRLCIEELEWEAFMNEMHKECV